MKKYVITEVALEALISDSIRLEKLSDAGVDNWQGDVDCWAEDDEIANALSYWKPMEGK